MNNQSRGVLRIGTSGIMVPGAKQTFPVQFHYKSRLNYYSSLFNSLEINSTFQKIPRPLTIEKWSSDVPENFRFTIKLWREITHIKQLKTDLENLDNFFKAADHIGNKKGCLLVQFPGSITVEYGSQVEQILQRLQKLNHENKWLIAIEFRNVTWYSTETYKLLNRSGAAIVLHDMPRSKNFVLNEAATFNFYRFHGPKGDYRGCYSDEFLEEHAENIRHSLKEGKDVYAYFNNTMGDAFKNAMSLKAMVEK